MTQLSSSGGVEGDFKGRVGGFRLDARFTLPATGVTALSGPSGAGKTTLLRCIAGLARLPGALIVDGQVWQDARSFLPPHKRPIGLVFQEASLLPHLSVRGNLLFGAKRTTAPAAIAFADIVTLLGIAPLLDRAVGKLSGGERQRVALGRALLSQPRLLLMDEPLSSLDAASKAEILPYLERLFETLGLPVLYVSHDPGEIARLADRVLVMRDGRIVDGDLETATGLAAARGKLAAMTPADRDALALAALTAGLPPLPGAPG